MCQEHIAAAQCVSENPSQPATCGQVHLVAAKRVVCDSAMGTCVCFFGTCGSIHKVTTPAAFALANLLKVRCVSCTATQERGGLRRTPREIMESPLLMRKAISSPSEKLDFKLDLMAIWKTGIACPFHATQSQEEKPVAQAQEQPAAVWPFPEEEMKNKLFEASAWAKALPPWNWTGITPPRGDEGVDGWTSDEEDRMLTKKHLVMLQEQIAEVDRLAKGKYTTVMFSIGDKGPKYKCYYHDKPTTLKTGRVCVAYNPVTGNPVRAITMLNSEMSHFRASAALYKLALRGARNAQG